MPSVNQWLDLLWIANQHHHKPFDRVNYCWSRTIRLVDADVDARTAVGYAIRILDY